MIHTKLPITESPTSDISEQKSTERFFESVLKTVEEAAIRTGTRRESKELIRIIMDMQYQASRTEIILWTKGEQQEFLERIESLLVNPGEYTTTQIKENLQAIISEEFSKAITRAKMLNLSLGVDLLKPSDVDFNFPMVDVNTTLVPMELHLAFFPGDSVQLAYGRLRGQYASRGFNAIILLDTEKKFKGIITLDTLQRSLDENPKALLWEIPLDITDNYGTLNTPKSEIEQHMMELGVNIYPIVDKNLLLIGILTHEKIAFTDVRFYAARLSTQVSESLLKQEIESKHTHESPSA